MTSLFPSRCSLFTLLVLAFVTICNVNSISGASTFAEIDISKTSGNGTAIKAAADKFCDATLSAGELMRRHGLADTAELNFFNPRVIESLKQNNVQANKALNCQKYRNKVLKNSCELQASIKQNLKCETDENTKEVAENIKKAEISCKGVNEKLFVNVTGINEPAPPQPKEACGSAIKVVFTSKYSDIDITKKPGSGDAIKLEAERVCGPDLSVNELQHRTRLAQKTERDFFGPKLKAAAKNANLKRALNCQKYKNKILIGTCTIQAAQKRNKPFQVEENTLKRQKIIEESVSICANADPNLFVDIGNDGSASASSVKSDAETIRPSAVILALVICLIA